jgi:hypothetical protein
MVIAIISDLFIGIFDGLVATFAIPKIKARVIKAT